MALSLKLTFSSQNHCKKFSQRTACLGPCPWGKEEEESYLPEGKIYLSRTTGRGFFEPCKSNLLKMVLTMLNGDLGEWVW